MLNAMINVPISQTCDGSPRPQTGPQNQSKVRLHGGEEGGERPVSGGGSGAVPRQPSLGVAR